VEVVPAIGLADHGDLVGCAQASAARRQQSGGARRHQARRSRARLWWCLSAVGVHASMSLAASGRCQKRNGPASDLGFGYGACAPFCMCVWDPWDTGTGRRRRTGGITLSAVVPEFPAGSEERHRVAGKAKTRFAIKDAGLARGRDDAEQFIQHSGRGRAPREGRCSRLCDAPGLQIDYVICHSHLHPVLGFLCC
jgi:hypothetical protein